MAAVYKINMQDGTTVDLTLNLGALSELSKKNKPLVDRYFALNKKMEREKDINDLEVGEIIYIGYACAHLNEDIPDISDFLYQVTDSRQELYRVFGQLFGRQEKKQDFQGHSKKRPKR